MFERTNGKLMFSQRAYNFTKKAAQIYIPAAGSLYFGLNAIWGLPAPEEVIGTLTVVDTFLGACLGVSTKNYNASGAAYDGDAVVMVDASGKKTYSLELNGDPADLDKKDSVSFKVVSASEEPTEGQEPQPWSDPQSST